MHSEHIMYYVFPHFSLKMLRNKTNIVTVSIPSVQVGILKYPLLPKASKFFKEMAIPVVEQKMYKLAWNIQL